MNFSHLKRIFAFESTIALVIAIATIGWMNLTDPDYFWHLKNGQLILEKHALFSVDLYSHTAQGNYSLITGWLFDVVIAWIWNEFGPIGVRCMSAGFIFITWLAIYKCVRLYIARKQSAALFALFTIVLIAPLIAARPNLFTHAAFAWVLFLLLAYCQSKRKTTLLYLLPIFFVWPYFHFGFAAGLGLIGLFIVAAYLDSWLPRSQTQPYSAMLGLWPLTVLLAAVIVGTFNNYGYHIYNELLQMTVRANNAPVSDWQSPNFKLAWQKILLVSIFMYIVALYLGKAKASWLYLIVPGILLWSLLTAQRNQGFWAIIIPVFLAIMIIKQSGNGEATSIYSKMNETSQQPEFTYYLNGFVILLTIAVVIIKAPETENTQLQSRKYLLPIEATDYLLENVPDGKLFNMYNSGGYIIWRTYPKFPVFGDTRYAPYNDKIIDDAIHIGTALPGTLDLLNQYEIEVILADLNTALFERILTSIKYRLVFLNETHSVFVANTEKYQNLPSVPSTIKAL